MYFYFSLLNVFFLFKIDSKSSIMHPVSSYNVYIRSTELQETLSKAVIERHAIPGKVELRRRT